MVTRLFPYIRSWLLLCLVLLAPLGRSLAQNGLQVLGLQVPLGTTPSSFTQNFDALNGGITVNLAGLVGNVDGIYSNRTLILASTGAPDLVSSIVPTAGGYSFGTTSERALGSNANLLNSAVGLVPIRYGAMIQNNTGLPITSLTVTYTGEQWYRDGDGAAQTLFFEYVPLGTVGSGLLGSLLNSTFLLAGGIGEALNLGGITYTPVSVSALNFVSPNFSGGTATLDGNAAGNRTTKTATISVNIPAGGYILLRWTDPDDPEGFLDLLDTDHSLAVDNLIVSATTLNSPPTVTGTIPGQSVTIGSTVNIPTSGAFTEPDGQTLAYAATGLPTGLTINATSGAITGTASVTGVYPVTVRVSDPQGLSASTTFSLTVNSPTANVSTSGPTCAGQNLTLSGLIPAGLPLGALVVLKGPNNFSVAVGGSGVVSIPTGTGGLPTGNYNLTLVATASLPLVGTVEVLNLPVPVSILPLPALPTGLASQTAAVGSLLSLTGVCEAGSVLNYITSTGTSGSSVAGIIPINTVSSGIQTVTALCVNITSGCASPLQLLNINVLNLVGNAINALPTAPVCLGQPLNLSLLGSGGLATLTDPLLSLTIAGPNGFLVTTSAPGSVLSLTGLPAGTYSLTITGALVPIVGAPITVPPIQVPVTVISLAPVTGLLASNTVVQNGMLTLIGSCPTGILSYSSSTGSSGTAISGIGIPINTGVAGAQSLTVVCLDPNGCLSVPTVANINVLAPALNVVQGALACVGQATSLTLVPTNFLLNDPLVNVSITGPAGVTVGALGSNGVVSIGGISTTATSLTVSVSIAGTPLINLPVSVSALPLPALPNLPSTLTALAGAPFSLSGLCPTGVLGTLSNLTQGIIPVNTTTAGVQTLSLICNNGSCISPAQVLSLSVLSPVLDVVQGALACVGQATSLTLLPTNFLLNDPLVSIGITGPAGVTVGALGSNGVVSIGGISTTATSLAVSLSVAGTQILNLPVSVSALPLPALPNLPSTLTALVGSTLSLSGLCPTGVLGTLSNLTQGVIPINTTTAGVQTLSLICNNGTCISPTQVLNLSIITGTLTPGAISPICLGQVLNLPLTGSGPLSDLTSNLVSLSVAGPVNLTTTVLGPGLISISGLTAGTSNLTITPSVSNVPLPSVTVPVNVISLSAVTGLLPTQTVVQNTTLTLAGTCPTGGILSYTSSGGSSGTALSGIGIPVVTNTLGGQSYTVVCTDANGCVSPATVASLSVIAPLLNVLQGPLACVGQPVSLTLLPVNFSLSDPLVSVGITGPTGVTASAVGANGVVTLTGISSATTTLAVSVSIAGVQVLNLPVTVNALPLPAAPNLPSTLTALVGSTLSLTGLCPTGTLGTLLNPLQGIINVPTTTTGIQSLTLTCSGANGCISPTTIVNLSVVSPLLNTLTNSPVCLGSPLSLTLVPLNFGINDGVVSLSVSGPVNTTVSAIGPNGVVSIGGLPAGSSNITVTARIGGTTVNTITIPVTVLSTPPPGVTTIAGQTAYAGGQTAVSVTANSGNVLFQASCQSGVLSYTGSTGGAVNTGAQTSFITVPTTTTGVFTYTAVCVNGACVSTGTVVSVSVVNAAPTNLPPTLVGTGIPSPQSATVNVGFSLPAANFFTDPNNDPLTFAATGLPAGLSITPGTGVISGAPSVSGTFPVSVTASDGKGGTVTSSFTLNVAPASAVNQPPVLSSALPTPQSATVGVAFSTTTAGAFTDPNGDPLSFTATGLPAGLSINPATGVISGVPAVSGTVGIVVTVSDGKGGTAQGFFILNVAPAPANNLPPTLVGSGIPSPQSATVGVAFSTTTAGAFTDPNGDPLSFTATGLPNGLSINPATGVISGVPATSGLTGVAVTATDGKGGSVTSTFILNVAPAPAGNLPPTVVGSGIPSPQSATVGLAFSTTTAGAFTDPNGDPLSFTATNLPTGITINPTTGFISGVPSVSGTFGIVVTANDGKGGIAQAVFVLNVAPAPATNFPPTLVGGKLVAAVSHGRLSVQHHHGRSLYGPER